MRRTAEELARLAEEKRKLEEENRRLKVINCRDPNIIRGTLVDKHACQSAINSLFGLWSITFFIFEVFL